MKNKIEKIVEILDKLYPVTGGELNYETPFQLLVGTILAAQATDKKVNEVTKELFSKYKTPYDFIKLSQSALEKEISQIHFYPTKAKHILAMSDKLIKRFGGEVPADREKLMELDGVGRKTANVILSYAFNIQAIAVDTHVFRVANRLGIVDAENVLKAELQMQKTIPEKWWSKTHSGLVLHGRRVCTAKKPKCGICELSAYCSYYKEEVKE
ncbi:MAG: endonuclease III [Bacillota bacterium]|nr:endonuclease III [Bacillota bacterium]